MGIFEHPNIFYIIKYYINFIIYFIFEYILLIFRLDRLLSKMVARGIKRTSAKFCIEVIFFLIVSNVLFTNM